VAAAKGGRAIQRPEADDLSRRYAELLAENLSQPGSANCCSLCTTSIRTATSSSAWCEIRFDACSFPPPGGVASPRRAEAQDLSSGTQAFLADVLAAR
jgi:hypothetical protein